MSDSPIEDPHVCNGAALRKASRRVSQLYDAILAPCGLKVSQHSILVHIDRGGNPSMTDLANAMVLDRSALAHNLKPLERDGYVVLTRDDNDGRSRRVSLTELGHGKLAESKSLWSQAQQNFESAYGAERAAALRNALSEIVTDGFVAAFHRN